MGIKVGKQIGGTVNNVDGVQANGGPGGTVQVDARRQIVELRQLLDQLGLPPTVDAAAQNELDRADAALATRHPDAGTVATALDRFDRLLSSAGALGSAGRSLSGPLDALARWIAAHSG